MKSIVFLCLFLLILSGCSQHNENISMQDKKIYEFSWCSYRDGFKAQDLNNELISYLGFLKNCSLLIGNSSSGMIESTYFQTPVINIGKRQQNREHGNHVKSIDGNTIKSIQNNILKNLKSKKKFKITKIYGDGNASSKIVKILEKIQLNKDLISKSISY